VQYFASNQDRAEVKFIAGSDSNKAELKGTSDSLKKVAVDVAGQVQKPGVYMLPEGSRLQDALIAAGGVTQEADREYMAKRLNLAQKVIDGGKIYIPVAGEANTVQAPNSGSNSPADTTVLGLDVSTNLIDINSADEEALDTLPKVGPVTAKKIIDNRPYGAKEELVSRKVMTQKTFDGLKDMIVVQ
ncbi:MAG: helix-hairpin-helix domain-containing protein, partial [Candidatus Levybacteria bacterium]|nr:helix-hairpin-helix domain-containing protein [Candidatus Levybacteria bacterium]